ncbi:MAG: Outer rane efflux protein [Verrucomicrobiales bacterium]|nr:Outer rane efflux protein [Verrucomicrobiales bacterium]
MKLLLTCAAVCLNFCAFAQTNASTTTVLERPLSRHDAVEIAMRQNSTILRGRADLRATHGVEMQLRSAAMPRVAINGFYNAKQSTLVNESFPGSSNVFTLPNQSWQADAQVQQPIYNGGRITSSLRAAKLTREQAVLNFRATVEESLLATRIAYDDVLLAQQLIVVQEASVNLLSNELQDVQRRYQAGTVPRFDVLRAEVELANERPRLITARNQYRISKNNLVNLLGLTLPRGVVEDIPLELTDKLEPTPVDVELASAVGRALEQRSDIAALRKAERLRHEDIVTSRAGYRPTLQAFGGYQFRSPTFTDDLARDLHGWEAGVNLSWSPWDGGLTRGRVIEAEARHERVLVDLQDEQRQIELEVRTAYSQFQNAREVLESQKKVQEQAEEALRLAEARMQAGSATQLDVLNAQTSLTNARTTQVQALHDYSVARSRLLRAIGEDLQKD